MVQLSRIDVLGGGPAGLHTAILFKKAMPAARVRVLEQNQPDATFGFGIVFSDQALDFLEADDPETHALVTPQMERWKNITLAHKGETVTLDGIGFSAIGRLKLLQILQERARDECVELHFNHAVDSVDELDGELIVGADGLNSLVRSSDEAAFGVSVDYLDNRFAWFGTPRAFDTLTQTFVATDLGTLNVHHYRYSPEMSTFIVECDAKTFDAYGFNAMDEEQTARVCERIFADTLKGAPLIINRSNWRRFPKLWCENWVAGNRALLGDAVHTAHFSIGSGTRLAMEDAIALVRAVRDHDSLDAGLAAYDRERKPIARKIVDAANTSAQWYEHFPEKMALEPYDFAFDYIMRSGRLDLERLRSLSPEFVAQYETRKTVAS